MSEKKSLTVFNQKLAGKLMMEGYKLQGIKPDRKYPERNVYFFMNCEEVRNIIKNFEAE
ncbi:MAG: hypothetical protein ACI4SR_04140 [Faecalibacillus sp.]